MIVRKGQTKMTFLWAFVIHCLLLICLPNLTSASEIRKCYEKYYGPPCSKAEHSAIDCIVNSVNSSWDPLDIKTKLTIKIDAMKSIRAKFCAEWPKLKDEVKTCEKKQCTPQNTQTVDLCGRNTARCHYLKYATCLIKAGMIQGKSMHELKSKLCIETDLNRGLIPYYGPHLQCYGDSIKYPVNIDFPLDHYLQFCQQFNYNQLKNCIEVKLAQVNSDQLFTDKTQFISDAKNLLQKTNHFCNSLLKIDNSFLTKCRMKNVRICMKEAFNRSTVDSDASYRGYYIPCISQQYAKCHAPIGAIINETLLMGHARSGFTTLSPSYIILFFAVLFSAVIHSFFSSTNS